MIKKIYKLSLVAFLGFGSFAFAQEGKVGINTDGDPKATLDIEAKVKMGSKGTSVDGLLIPRVDVERAEKMGTGNDGKVEESTLIYVSDLKDRTGKGIASNVDTKGFYYWSKDENKWMKVGGGVANAELTGGTRVKVRECGSNIGDGTCTVKAEDFMITVVNSNSGQYEVNMPASEEVAGRALIIVNRTQNANVKLLKDGEQIINGTQAEVITPDVGEWIVYDGAKWFNLINY